MQPTPRMVEIVTQLVAGLGPEQYRKWEGFTVTCPLYQTPRPAYFVVEQVTRTDVAVGLHALCNGDRLDLPEVLFRCEEGVWSYVEGQNHAARPAYSRDPVRIWGMALDLFAFIRRAKLTDLPLPAAA
jgi:hypothetical protein